MPNTYDLGVFIIGTANTSQNTCAEVYSSWEPSPMVESYPLVSFLVALPADYFRRNTGHNPASVPFFDSTL